MQDLVYFQEIPTASHYKIGRATLNNPANLNALSQTMIDMLYPQLKRWETDADIAVVFIDSRGDKAFCAGGDIVALFHAIQAAQPEHAQSGSTHQTSTNSAAISRFFASEYRLDYTIHRYCKPIVCWGHGIVMGGGMGIYVGASHRIATPQSRLAMPEISIGLFPDIGASWFLQRLPKPLGLWLAMSALPISARDARYVGLAEFVLEHRDQAALLADLSKTIWTHDAGQNAYTLSQTLQTFESKVLPKLPASTLATHLEPLRQNLGYQPTLAHLRECMHQFEQSEDAWLKQAAKNFFRAAPSSIALTHQLLQRTRHASLAEALRIEYRLALACAARTDFVEGIRALVIDKDKTPHWKPETEIDSAYIDAHFAHPIAELHPLHDLQ